MPDGTGTVLLTFLSGAAVALLPVYFRLRHEREERKQERVVQLRRGVYLEAFEALGKSTFGLMSLVRTDIPPGAAFESLQSNMGWNYRAFAVGETSTVKAFIAAGEYLQEALLELAKYRFDLDEHNRRLAANENNRKQLIDYQSYLDAERSNLPATPEGRKRAVQLLFEAPEVQRRIQELGTEIDNNYAVQLKLHMILTIEAASRAAELQRRLVPVFLAIRDELEIAVPDGEYRRSIEEAARKSEANLNDFVEHLRQRAAGEGEGHEAT